LSKQLAASRHVKRRRLYPLQSRRDKEATIRFEPATLRRALYCGSTVWNTDFAADNMSSATALARSRALAASFAAARRSSGGGDGISAGGVGRFGSSLRIDAV